MKKKSFKKGMAFVLSAMLTCGVVYAAPENLLTANADELGGGTQQSDDAGELTPAGEGAGDATGGETTPQSESTSGAAIDGNVKLMENDPTSNSTVDTSIFTYTEYSGKITITGLADGVTLTDGKLVIPATIDGKTVTAIGTDAFRERTIQTVTFAEGCNVLLIDRSAFSDCTQIKSVSIPDSVTTIGSSAFKNCTSLPSITIPDGVTTIGSSAFSGCSSLGSVTIPDSVTTIGTWAFYGCSILGNITIPSSVKTIGNNAFSYCTGLVSVENNSKVTEIAESTFECCASLAAITIPDSVTNIGKMAFKQCGSLKEIKLPNNLTTIGESAFETCAYLTSIVIPSSVREIGDKAFFQCWRLADVTIQNGVTNMGNSVFCQCDRLTSITIPGSLETINFETFFSCDDLEEVVIQNGVKKIGAYAFTNCHNLKKIEIPSCVTEIGEGAFENCMSMTNIVIPNGVKTIGNDTFCDCRSLGSITIPSSVEKIGEDKDGMGATVFVGCDELDDIYIWNIEANLPGQPWGADWNGNTPPSIHWLGIDIGCDYAKETLKNFETNIGYTVNGKTVNPTGGSLAIDESWFGNTVSIVKTTGGAANSTQKLAIPERPAAPTGLTATNVSAKGQKDGVITGAADTEYRLSGEITWKQCSTDTISDLAAGTYEVRKCATDSSFASKIATVVIAEPDALGIDYDKLQITGLDPSSTYTINGETVTPSKDGTLDIDKAWYGKEITIEKTAPESGASITEKIAIPKKADMPTGVGAVNASGKDKADGKITGISDQMEYRLLPEEDGAAITWKDCTGDTVTGLAPGKYEVRIKVINGESFSSDPVEVTIGVTEPDTSGDTSGSENAGGSSSSDSDDDDDDDDSYSTGKDDKGNTGGGTTTTDPTTPVDPTPTTPVTPDPTTPVTPVTPDPTTPVTPDPATPTTPEQGGTGNAGTTDQGNAGQSGSDNGNGSGNGGSSAGTTSDRDSDDDRDSSSSSHRGNSNRGNSSSSSSSTSTDANGTTAGTTDDAATNGSKDSTGAGTGSQSSNVSGITASVVTDATSIAETVKTSLDNALASVLKKDSKVKTGPYVQSDSSDIKVEIPSDLQKSGRTFYLMTAKDNGDIVILSNESSEDGVFEATGEAGTDYMMIFEDGETPLAAMITNDGTLNVAEDSNCYNHLIGLGLALIGLAAAALLARKGKRYFWAASAAGIALALVASATGSCHLDWICFAGEAVVTVAATAALWMKQKKVTEQ